jgi:hypothetical protein
MKINIQAVLIALVLLCLAASAPNMQAVNPPPDGGYSGLNTAEGTNALKNLSTGVGNAAVGWFSLFSNTDGSFNTALGAGTLLLNVGNQNTGEGLRNTAIGAAALLFNSSGAQNTAAGVAALLNNDGNGNTAIGDSALFSNTAGDANTATGFFALLSNTTGQSNTASGVDALVNNTEGNSNTAFGFEALDANIAGNENTAVGTLALGHVIGNGNTALGFGAGNSITTANNVIAIGAVGVSTSNGQVDNSCYIGNIFNKGVDAGTALLVFVDQDGKLGTGSLSNTGMLPSTQTLSGKIQELETTVGLQAKAIAVLTAQLNEQAAQIQKVSARVR